MSEMVERVAKAQSEEARKWCLLERDGKWYAVCYHSHLTMISEEALKIPFGHVIAHRAQEAFDDVVRKASVRAGIQAMREPTDNMVRAGLGWGMGLANQDVKDGWYAMIDEALR